MEINIKSSDRVCFFGRTGCGKTTLAKFLLKQTNRPFAILDPKHDFTMNGVPITDRFEPKKDKQIIRVPPVANEMELWDACIYEIWRHGDRIIYVDEGTLVTPSRSILPALGRAIRTGRSIGVAVWFASQRPKDIPSAVFTEAEHFFVFQLTFEADRKKVVEFTGDRMDGVLPRLRNHDFAYYGVQSDEIAYVKKPPARS